MIFDPSAPLGADQIAAARAFVAILPALESGERVDSLALHWPVESFGCTDGSYNCGVRLKDGVWTMEVWQDPRHNAVHVADSPYRDIAGNPLYAAHLFGRNSHCLGLAIQGMLGATPEDFGRYGIQQHELEWYCAMVAAVGEKYGVDCSVTEGVRTHAEWAIIDGYFPGDGDSDSRWDLAILSADQPVTKPQAAATGNLLRERIHTYKAAAFPS
jgi:hypothetical protein